MGQRLSQLSPINFAPKGLRPIAVGRTLRPCPRLASSFNLGAPEGPRPLCGAKFIMHRFRGHDRDGRPTAIGRGPFGALAIGA
jgi:hypothetical protein